MKSENKKISTSERLKQMLGEDKLTALLQPVVSVNDHAIHGFEALARGGYTDLYSAPELFRAAEESGMVGELTLASRRHAIDHVSSLEPHQKLFINFHKEDLSNPRICYGAPDEPLFSCKPEQIVIELSDSDLLSRRDETLETLKWLKNRGFQIAIDNMGGDTSTIRDVKSLMPDYIKVDRSLTRGIHKSRTKRALVEAIKEMSQEHGAQMVVEGIESAEELRVVDDLGADYCQGFYFSIPKPTVISRADFSNEYRRELTPCSNFAMDDMKYRTIRKLTEVNAELLKRIKSRDRFITYIVHDLKSPLTSIRMNADTLVDSGHSGEDSFIQGSIDSIASESDRLCRLVDDLLDFSVLQNSGIELQPEETNVSELVMKCIRNQSRLAQSKSLYLKLDGPEEKIVAEIDGDQMARVITNLISNAIEFTQSGGIWIAVRREKDQLIISVTDTGVGVDREIFSNIFDPFVKLKNSAGTGIGLAVAKAIVEAHHGTICAESTDKKGTIFTITMPDRQDYLLQ